MPMRLPEMIVIFVVALLVFGPKRLPEMGASIGKSIQAFRKGMSELSQPKASTEWEDKMLELKRLELQELELQIARKKAEVASYQAPEPAPSVYADQAPESTPSVYAEEYGTVPTSETVTEEESVPVQDAVAEEVPLGRE